MSQRKVSINFNSYMKDTQETVSLVSEGMYYERNGKHFVLYTENEEEGMAVKSMLKFNDKSLEVTRTGAARTKMCYEQGLEHRDYYRTPAGTLDMVIKTRLYAMSANQEGFEILTEYSLYMGDSHVTDSRVSIKISFMD